jgi:hypothetical protein
MLIYAYFTWNIYRVDNLVEEKPRNIREMHLQTSFVHQIML